MRIEIIKRSGLEKSIVIENNLVIRNCGQVDLVTLNQIKQAKQNFEVRVRNLLSRSTCGIKESDRNCGKVKERFGVDDSVRKLGNQMGISKPGNLVTQGPQGGAGRQPFSWCRNPGFPPRISPQGVPLRSFHAPEQTEETQGLEFGNGWKESERELLLKGNELD